MELDPYDTSFDYGIDDQNFYDNPPIKKENIKKVTFNAKICSMVSNWIPLVVSNNKGTPMFEKLV